MKARIAGGVTTALCLIDAVAFHPKALEMRTGRLGARIFRIPMRDEAVRRYGRV